MDRIRRPLPVGRRGPLPAGRGRVPRGEGQRTAMTTTTTATRAEVCVAACADAWADDGEIFGSPMGLIPMLGARLCRLTSNPDLLLSDGEALLLGEVPAIGAPPSVVEGWIPFRRVFDVIAYGKRHVMMGASQL